MNRYFFILLVVVFICGYCHAQENLAVTDKLKQTYQWVRYYDKSYFDMNAGRSFYLVKENSNNKTVGLCDENGDLIVPPGKYEFLMWEYRTEKILDKSNIIMGRIGKSEAFLNEYGEEVFKVGKYSHVEDCGMYYLIFRGTKRGIANKNGDEIIAPQYDYILNKGIGFWVRKGTTKENFINYQGKPYFTGWNPYKVYYDETEGLAYKAKPNSQKMIVSNNCMAFFIPAAKEYMRAYSFGDFAKKYVAHEIKKWQKKNEYETLSQWKERLDSQREQQIQMLIHKAEQKYTTERQSMLPKIMSLGPYDADNQTYIIKSLAYSDILVKVSRNEAEYFKSNFDKFNKEYSYSIINDVVDLKDISFQLEGHDYHAERDSNANYLLASVDYNFEPINIDLKENNTNTNISTLDITVGKSDVDVNIPLSTNINENTFAVIIANEKYQREQIVEFAQNDGSTFRKYCQHTLGLPEKNIHYVADATLNNIRAEINWITQVATAYKGKAKIIFYYAGHGIPDEVTRSAYLLPIDGLGSDVSTGYKLTDLYSQLNSCPTQLTIVFLDACFSGIQRSGKMIASARGVAIKAKSDIPLGNNIVVFSAASGDETAYPYREQGHGMFTYFLLKKLQETNGNATLAEISDYVTDQVGKRSIVENSKSQTPNIIPASGMADNWKNIKLK